MVSSVHHRVSHAKQLTQWSVQLYPPLLLVVLVALMGMVLNLVIVRIVVESAPGMGHADFSCHALNLSHDASQWQ